MLSTSQEGEGVRLAPWAHGSRREAFHPGTRVRPSASLKRLRLCALMPFGCGCSWREAARIVGDGVAVVVRPDAVRVVAAHGVKLLRSGRGCAHLPGLKRSGRVVCFESYTLLIYIIRKQTILI